MKKVKLYFVLSLMMLMLAGLFSLAGTEDCYDVDELDIHPGFQTFTFFVQDVNGNYEGNHLKVQINHNAPEGISMSLYYGLSVYEADPNWLIIDDAVFDSNSADPNLYGSFSIAKPWRNYDYEFNITVADQADNNSCGTAYFYSWDKGKPKLTGVRKYQK